MKINSVTRTLTTAALFLGVSLACVGAHAQSEDMSVEELEQFVAEQKELLNEAKLNRDETEAQAAEVREALAEQEARREQLEKEVDDLCSELDKADPGSYDDCKAKFSN